MRQKVIVGNWKMFKNTAEAVSFAEKFKQIYRGSEHEVGICCPFTQIPELKRAFAGTDVKVGAQNMHYEDEGPYTGEISAGMLTELNVDYCILGHSERRQYFFETDELINLKLKTAFNYNIKPILCIGERLEQRDSKEEFDVVENQLLKTLNEIEACNVQKLIIAYEPVWAIGTGRTASPEQAEEMCAFIRGKVKENYDDDTAEKLRIQYGGSVKPGNATELLTQPNIDGALVGGASLDPEGFIKIVNY